MAGRRIRAIIRCASTWRGRPGAGRARAATDKCSSGCGRARRFRDIRVSLQSNVPATRRSTPAVSASGAPLRSALGGRERRLAAAQLLYTTLPFESGPGRAAVRCAGAQAAGSLRLQHRAVAEPAQAPFGNVEAPAAPALPDWVRHLPMQPAGRDDGAALPKLPRWRELSASTCGRSGEPAQ